MVNLILGKPGVNHSVKNGVTLESLGTLALLVRVDDIDLSTGQATNPNGSHTGNLHVRLRTPGREQQFLVHSGPLLG